MREMLIVFQRDFLAHVNTRAFIISTILVPTLTAVMLMLPQVMDAGATRTFVLVNEASEHVGTTFAQSLTAAPRTERDNRYFIKRETGAFASLRASLNERVLANEIEGYVVIPSDVLSGAKILYRARSVSSPKVIFDLQLAAQRAVQSEKLQQSGVDSATVQVLWERVSVDSVRITRQGEKPGSAYSGFMFAYLVAFLIYILVVMYGASILRSVFEEKRNRISEIVVSSIPAGRFLAGKILGVGAAAVLQVVIWAAIVLTILGLPILSSSLQVSSDTVALLSVDPGVAAALLFFFLVGFFLYASMFAALGAASGSEQDAQSMQGLLFVPIIVPLLFMGAVINDPAGRTAQVLSLIPFTSPITMPMRLASAPVPAGEIVTSSLVLLATLLVFTWAAGKIYRIGILSTGKRPGLVELYRWMRTA
jgi:ABC-2 type transport system permease protein